MLVRNRTTGTDSDVTNKERVTSFHVVTPRALPVVMTIVIHLRTAVVVFCAPTAIWVYTTAATAGESDGRGGDDVNEEQDDGEMC